MDDRGRLAAFWMLARLGRTTRDELTAYGDAQVRRLVVHAGERVPYYRRLFEAHGIQPGEIRGTRDLSRLPTTDRIAYQAAADGDLRSRDVDAARLVELRTAGTAHRPLALYRAPGEERLRSAARFRALHDMGVRPRDHQVGLSVAPRAADPKRPRLPQRVLRTFGLFRRTQLDVRQGLSPVVDTLRRLRPEVLMAYPSMLARLAALCSAEARAEIRPRLAICGAEVLTPTVAATIESAFGAAVRDWYGCNETGLIAWQCPHAGLLHVALHSVVLEVIRDGRPAEPGESGEVVVTGLYHYAMPFIRYRLGDIVTRGPDPCPCGAPFPTLLAVDGRTWETVSLANGRLIYPSQFYRVVQKVGMRWVGQFQLVQTAPDAVAFRIALRAAPGTAELDAMRGALDDLFGPGTRVEVRLESEIEAGPSGKVSRVRPLPADLTSR
jgi:phenylacetate-CoA ligase